MTAFILLCTKILFIVYVASRIKELVAHYANMLKCTLQLLLLLILLIVIFPVQHCILYRIVMQFLHDSFITTCCRFMNDTFKFDLGKESNRFCWLHRIFVLAGTHAGLNNNRV